MKHLPLLSLLLLVLAAGCPASPPVPPSNSGGAGGEGGAPGTGGGVGTECPPLVGFDAPSCGPNGCWEHPLPGPLDVELGAVDAEGGLWVAGWGTPPLRFDGAQWVIHSEGLPLPSARVRALHASGGAIWAVQEEQIFRLQEGRWKELEREAFAFAPHAIWDSGDALWLAGSQVRRYVDGNWQSLSVVGHGPFHALWGSEDQIWAVGARGAVYAWRDESWGQVPLTTDVSLRSIWGSSPREFWIGGEAGKVFRWNGAGFEYFDLGTGATILSIAGSGPEDVLALGYDANAQEGVLFHWNGKSWWRVPSAPGLTPLALWPAAEGVWVGGKGAGLAFWNGACLRVKPGWGESLNALWAGEWAVGARGLLLRRTESGWERRESGVDANLRDLWSWSGDLWIVGEEGLILRGGEDGFRHVLGAEGRHLLSIHGSEGGPLWIGTHDGNIYRTDGTTLRRTPTPTVWPIRSLASFEDEAWATSEQGEVLRWDGNRWRRDRLANGRPHVFGTAADDLWLAGFEGGAAMIEHWDGETWTVVSTGSATTVYALVGDDERLYVAHGPRILRRWDGEAWTAHVLPVRPRALALDGESLWILGERHLVHWRDEGVEAIFSSPYPLSALHAGEGEVWVGTEDGRMGAPGAEGLEFGEPIVDRAIRSIHGDDKNLWAAGDGGALLRFVGDWRGEPLGTDADLRAVAVRGDQVWLASSVGLLRKVGNQAWSWYEGSPSNLSALWVGEGLVYVASVDGGVYALDSEASGILFTVDSAMPARAVGRALGSLWYGGAPLENGTHFLRFGGQHVERIDLGVTMPASAVAPLERGRAIVAQGERLFALDRTGFRAPLGKALGDIREFSRQDGALVPTALGTSGGILGLHLLEYAP